MEASQIDQATARCVSRTARVINVHARCSPQQVNEALVAASGKLVLLDKLLPKLKQQGAAPRVRVVLLLSLSSLQQDAVSSSFLK